MDTGAQEVIIYDHGTIGVRARHEVRTTDQETEILDKSKEEEREVYMKGQQKATMSKMKECEYECEIIEYLYIQTHYTFISQTYNKQTASARLTKCPG